MLPPAPTSTLFPYTTLFRSPELLDRRPGWGGGKRNAVTVSLAPLCEDETARLIAQLLNRSVLPAETQAALLARAGGNPLYAEDRKSTRLNSSHTVISYAVFC